MSAGHVTTGATLSLMLTLKLQVLVLPAASVARQVTVLVPLAKVEPLAGVQLMLAPGQLSVTVTV